MNILQLASFESVKPLTVKEKGTLGYLSISANWSLFCPATGPPPARVRPNKTDHCGVCVNEVWFEQPHLARPTQTDWTLGPAEAAHLLHKVTEVKAAISRHTNNVSCSMATQSTCVRYHCLHTLQ